MGRRLGSGWQSLTVGDGEPAVAYGSGIRLFGRQCRRQPQCSGDTRAIGRIRQSAVGHVPVQDGSGYAVHGTRRIPEQGFLLPHRHLAKEIARLLEVIHFNAMVPMTGRTLQGEHGFGAQWAGQGAPMARAMPAAILVETLREELRRSREDC